MQEIFDLVVASGEVFPDSGFTCANIPPWGISTMLVAGHEGSVGLLDVRTKKWGWVATDAHDKKTNSIECHPTSEHYYVTGSTDRIIKLWDDRKHKKPIYSIAHTNSLNNVTFNPTGEYMLSTCQDHNLYVYHNALQLKEPTVKSALHKIKHNNNTGR